MAPHIKLTLGALGFEALALGLLLRPGHDLAVLAGYALPHAVSSLLLARLMVLMWELRSTEQKRLALTTYFAWCFFLPVTGFLAVIIAWAVERLLPAVVRRVPFAQVRVPLFAALPGTASVAISEGGIRARLTDQTADLDARMKALLAVQSLPMRVASPLLRQMLGDAVDDIRLVAYGILDAQEKRINARIREELTRLAAARGAARLDPARRLAELYWELIYQDLVQGDVALHAAGEAERFLAEAMALETADAGLWLLRAKLAERARRLDEAREAFATAVQLGTPLSATLPYLAEIAFLKGDYAEVKRVLEDMKRGQVPEKIEPVVEFWCGP